MKIEDFSSLSFLYDPDHFSWLRRHYLNCICRREIRKASHEGRKIGVANSLVAEEMHRYYRVPMEDMFILPQSPGSQR